MGVGAAPVLVGVTRGGGRVAVQGGWVNWQTMMPRYSIPAGAQFQSIVVPTIDTVRNSWLIDQLIVNSKHVLCVGDTGTGKSVSLLNKLQKELNKEVYLPILLSFSAQTSANQTQDIVDSKLTRLRKVRLAGSR